MNKTSILLGLALSMSPIASMAQEAAQLPPSGEKVSLDRYDSYIQGLTDDIDIRLQQLSASEAELPKPSMEGNEANFRGMSKIQVEIEVLTKQLEKAKLARQVYEEIHSDKTPEYLAQIEGLQSALLSREEELETVRAELEQSYLSIRSLEEQNGALQREIEESANNTQQMAEEIERLTLENESLELRAQELLIAAASGGGGSDLTGEALLASINSASAARSSNLPAVETISMVHGKASAELYLPDGSYLHVEVGDEIAPNSRITRIEQRSVYYEENGKEKRLPFSSRNGQPTDASGFNAVNIQQPTAN